MATDLQASPPTSRATYPDLADAAVLISGGASGIGEALVRSFADQGSRVGFVDIDETRGEALSTSLRNMGHACIFQAADVGDVAAFVVAITCIERQHGKTNVLINNAANDTRHDWRTVTPLEWDQRFAVNHRHAFFAIQAVAPAMIEAGRGSIINMGSISWMVMSPGIPVYESAKAAMHGLTRAMAKELGPYHIRVNTLAKYNFIWVNHDLRPKRRYPLQTRQQYSVKSGSGGDHSPPLPAKF